MLTPLDITQREFRKVFRGFDPEEVRAFLEDIAQAMEQLLKENTLLGERLRRMEEELRLHTEREEVLKRTLLTAQQVADGLKENAKKEAELLLKEAELKAEKLIEEAYQRLTSVQMEVEELKRQKAVFEARLRSAIKLHLDLLETEPEEGPRSSDTPPSTGS